jgi:uncharacterized membrane protein
MEETFYMINTFIHILATVLFVGGPFYMTFVVTKERMKLGPPLEYRLEKYMENIIELMPLICFISWGMVVATGFGFPLIYYFFHGALKPVSSIVMEILVIKHILVFAVFGLMVYMLLKIRTRILEIMYQFDKDQTLDEALSKELVELRTRRRNICKTIFFIQLPILFLSGILRFLT